jgi:hypothetical protein
MAEGDTLVNALVGGVASIVLSLVPFSPVLGGAVAGYLEGGSRGDGLRVGFYAGLVAAVPVVLVLLGGLALAGVVVLGAGPRAGAGIGLVVLVVGGALVVGGLYTVGLSTLGGWLGNYVKYDTELFD